MNYQFANQIITFFRFGKRPGFGGGRRDFKIAKVEPPAPTVSKPLPGSNVFSNDGSFMEQFMKMQGVKSKQVNF
jgi:hypothetical protein